MSWLYAARQRLRDRFASADSDRELRDEIAHHLELETALQLRRCGDPSLASARALARFGNPDMIADATRAERGHRTLEGGMQDLRWSIRSLRASAGFTALAVCTLTLGIGATTVAFTVLDTVLLRPLPYANAGQLVLIRERTDKQALLPPSYPNFASWRDGARSFDGVASATYPSSRTVLPTNTAADPLRVQAMGVSRRFFAILGVAPAVGREFTDDENRLGGSPAVMVSYELWQSQLGGRLPLGSITWSDSPTPVVGVLPPGFTFVSPADVYFPHERAPGTVRSAHSYLVVARLRHGVSLATARADMSALSRSLLGQFGMQTQAADADIIPLRDYLVSDYRTLLAIVFGAAALVLLIACTNLMSAQLARGRAREREVVIRAALGASRARLIRQLLFESGAVVALGTSFATLLALGATKAIKTAGKSLLPRLNELALDVRVLAFVAAVATLTVLLVGVYPAVRLANRDAGLALRAGRDTSMTVRASVWRLLVGFEIALAVVLVVGSSLLIKTLHNILTANTGFDAHGVVTASIVPSDEDARRMDYVITSVRALPGVEGAALTSRLPLAWGTMSAPVRRVGDPPDHDWPGFAGFRIVSPEYFAVLRQPVLRGRAFTAGDRDGTANVAVVTPGVAEKLWPGDNPIGKLISTNYLFDQWLTVVGVVGEASSWTMPRGSQNEIYVPYAQHANASEGQLVAIVRTRGSTDALLPALRTLLHELIPASPAQFGTMDERIARSAADRRFAMLALTTFGAVALILAAIGIYGVIWYIVSTRTHEIGIRMALGATASLVRRDVLRGAASMAVAGIVAGIGGGLFATRFLQSSLYGVSRLDPRTYAAGAAVALCTAMLAAYVPARRSSRVDPMIAIRGD